MGPDAQEPGRAEGCVQTRELEDTEWGAAEPEPGCPCSRSPLARPAHSRSEPLTEEPREPTASISPAEPVTLGALRQVPLAASEDLEGQRGCERPGALANGREGCVVRGSSQRNSARQETSPHSKGPLLSRPLPASRRG